MKKLCFSSGQSHVRVPNPFSVFFDNVGYEQRGGTAERAMNAPSVLQITSSTSAMPRA